MAEPDLTKIEQSLGIVERRLDAVGKTANAGAMGLNNLGMRMLMVGQFADDMQYGLRGIVNNVPQLVMAFGGSAGIAGALSVVAVAANQAFGFIEESLDRIGRTKLPQAISATQQLADAEKRLGELRETNAKKGLTQSEQGEFRRLEREIELKQALVDVEKERLEASQHVAAIEGDADSKRSAAVTEQIKAMGGGAAVVEQLLKQTALDRGQAEAVVSSSMKGNQGMIDFMARVFPQIGRAASGELAAEDEAIAADRERQAAAYNRRMNQARSAMGQWNDAMTLEYARERQEGTTSYFGVPGTERTASQRFKESLRSKYGAVAEQFGLMPEDVDKLVAEEFRGITDGFKNAVRSLAASTGMTAGEAEAKLVKDMDNARRQAQKNAKLASRQLTDEEVEEVQDDMRQRRRANFDRQTAMVDEDLQNSGMLPGLTERIARLARDPRFSRRFGRNNVAEASNIAQQELEKDFRAMGATPEQARMYASQAVQASMPGAQELTDAMARIFPQTAKELIAVQKRQMAIHERMLQNGLPLTLRRR